jgi:hypothetical protein
MVIWVLVLLSIILTLATIFPTVSGAVMLKILIGGGMLGLIGLLLARHRAIAAMVAETADVTGPLHG